MIHRTLAEDQLQLEADRNDQLNDLSDSDLADLLLDEVWGPLSSLTPEATIVGQAYDRLKRSKGGALVEPIHLPASNRDLHGVTCPKAIHDLSLGAYLHTADDDGPYDVDGVLYCGRCHHAL